jgi:hypothetical protein
MQTSLGRVTFGIGHLPTEQAEALLALHPTLTTYARHTPEVRRPSRLINKNNVMDALN